MDSSNIALSVVMNHSICEELKHLREENKVLKNCIKNANYDINNRTYFYNSLVYLARRNPNNTFQERGEYVKSEIGEEVYKKELEKLKGEYGNYTHGFNSGILATTRLYGELLKHTPTVYENENGSEEELSVEDAWRSALSYFPDIET
jgi:hypothetical protein